MQKYIKPMIFLQLLFLKNIKKSIPRTWALSCTFRPARPGPPLTFLWRTTGPSRRRWRGWAGGGARARRGAGAGRRTWRGTPRTGAGWRSRPGKDSRLSDVWYHFFSFSFLNHTVPTTVHDYTLKKLPQEKMGNKQKNTMWEISEETFQKEALNQNSTCAKSGNKRATRVRNS